MKPAWLWVAAVIAIVLVGLGLWAAFRVERPRFLTIHEAVREGDLADTKYHLSHGADIRELNESGYSPLHLATAYGHPKIAEYLLAQGAQVDAREEDHTPRYYTPLHLAAREHNPEVAQVLLKHGADPNARDVEGYTPLHVAARHNSAQTAPVLLAGGADVNAQNDDGNTPLAVAVKWKKLEVGRILVQYGGVRQATRRGPGAR